jgi:hypothetical protein
MDMLFGDATTAMPTPQTRAETASLIGVSSPVPSMDLRRGIQGAGPSYANNLGPANAIPGLDIDPPHVSIVNGKPQYAEEGGNGEGVGGWISRMVQKAKGDEGSVRSGKSGNSKYKPLGQDEEQDEEQG